MLKDLPGESECLHRRKTGWYSHSVLAHALSTSVPPMWRLVLRPASIEDWEVVSASRDVAGILVNVRNVHWASITREGPYVFYVDSQHLPVEITQDSFACVLDDHPMSFMVVRGDSVL